MNENLGLLKWLYLNCGSRAAIGGMIIYSKVLLTKNFWSKNHINLNYKGKNLEILFYGGLSMLKEIFKEEIYKSNLGEASTIVDIGANVGFYSIWASCNYPKAKIYSYEPVSKIYELLETNISINNFTNIFPSKKAVSDKKGESTIYLSYASGFSSIKNSTGDKEKINISHFKTYLNQTTSKQ